jgi:hypothetical protein
MVTDYYAQAISCAVGERLVRIYYPAVEEAYNEMIPSPIWIVECHLSSFEAPCTCNTPHPQ